ncbi:cell adhesion molecule 3-like [Takifugu flavidus]|uniref:cell adhesion molecule 3-like n=1 Tax=Takifugu flavidus TaxID=433684 RepID=UPI00254441BB|nr:cell adhesion molecule 3-like [Takifugu flavidus]
MFLSTLLLVALMDFLIHFSEQCVDAPVFTPPSLVVKFGASATANCSVCEKDCLGTVFGLEHAIGSKEINGTSIVWKVNSLTEWDTSLLCYYNHKDGRQCSKTLGITLYKPPDRVLVSFGHGSELLLEGESYLLECLVKNIAPLKHLIVTFYKGPEALAQMYFNSSREPKPVTKTSILNITASKEDDGAQYWCDARLNLDVQEVPLTVSSQKLYATVYYEPRLLSPLDPVVITVTEGEQLELNCSAVGKPTPSYVWTHPTSANIFSNTSVYSIKSVTFGNEGQYNCTASNIMGTVTVNFSVHVKGNYWYIGYIIGALIAAIVLIIIVGLVIYNIYYKHKRTGSYSPVQSNHLRTEHPPVPKSA